MVNDWKAYERHFHEIMTYIDKLKRKHGVDGERVAIEDLAFRLARLRAGIEESAVYGE